MAVFSLALKNLLMTNNKNAWLIKSLLILNFYNFLKISHDYLMSIITKLPRTLKCQCRIKDKIRNKCSVNLDLQ